MVHVNAELFHLQSTVEHVHISPKCGPRECVDQHYLSLWVQQVSFDWSVLHAEILHYSRVAKSEMI